MEKEICIVGHGVIGQRLAQEFEQLEVKSIDKYRTDLASSYEEDIAQSYDYAFICVPTQSLPDGSCNISEVEDAVSRVNAKIIVIKSAVPVGTASKFAQKYGKSIVVSPEYYGVTQHSPKSPNWVTLGGSRRDCTEIAQLYYTIKEGSFRVFFTDRETAELAKYASNAFFALKVTFCNEMATIGNLYGINYEELRECMVADERFGDKVTFVYKDKPYYDSCCLNKDVKALIHQGKGTAPLMEAICNINKERKARDPKRVSETH